MVLLSSKSSSGSEEKLKVKTLPHHPRISRTETNLIRLLSKCEMMAKDSAQDSENWRLEKFIATAESMLNELRTGPNQPDNDKLQEYSRRIDFVKEIIQTSKLQSVSKKVVVSSLIKPSSSTSSNSIGVGDNNKDQMEIKHRNLSKYSSELRKELLGENSSPSKRSVNASDGDNSNSPQKGERKQDVDEILKYHHDLQEKIADHMLELTRSLKEQVTAAGHLVKKDVEVLDKSSKQIESNQGNLKVQTGKLSEFNKRACKCWVWFMMFLVIGTFVTMVLFMRLFKKRTIINN